MEGIKSRIYRLLRQSESFFKTDMVYLAHGGFWLTLVQITGALSAFALSVFFARVFPKDAYGTYKYVIALAAIIGTFTLTGLSTAVAQSVSLGFDGALKKGFRLILRWGVIIVAISVAMALYYLTHKNYVLALSLLLIAVTSPLIDAASLFSSFLNGKKDFRTLSFLYMVGSIFPAASLIITLLITRNIFAIIAVYFLSYTCVIFFSYFYTVWKYKPKDTVDKGMIPYAKHLTFINILNVIADQADKIIVYHYVGAVELAVYSFATALPLQIKSLAKMVYPLAFPKFASRPTEEIKKELPNKMLILFLIILAMMIGYIAAAPWIFKIFFPQYTNAVFASQIFALSLPTTVNQLPSTYFQAKKRVDIIYKSNVIFSIIKLTSLFVGVLWFGFWGVIGARVIYEYIGVGIVYYYTYHTE